MLKSKRDESIKRYLARVGKLEHRSKLYNSVYYKVSYGEDIEIIVRFADHFNTEVKTKDVDIVKTSVGFYVIKTNIGVSVTLGEDTIIPYLRSLLLVYPEVSSSMNAFINASQKAEKQLINAAGRIAKLESEIKKKSEEFDLADDIMNENKKLISENKSLRNTVNLQKSQYGNLKAKHEKLTVTFQRLNALKDQLNTLFGQLTVLKA